MIAHVYPDRPCWGQRTTSLGEVDTGGEQDADAHSRDKRTRQALRDGTLSYMQLSQTAE